MTAALPFVTVTGIHPRYSTEGENLAAGARDWTHFAGGAFRRGGLWFIDITRGTPDRVYRPWRVTAVPALLPVNARVARTGGDIWRHDPDPAHATNLGEFFTYALAIRAGDRWLKAQNRANV